MVGLAALLGAPAAVDRFVSRPDVGDPVRVRLVNPSATPELAGASTWFCGSGRTAPDGAADLTVTVANPTENEIPGRVTWFGSEAGREPIVQPVLAASHSRIELAAPREIAGGPIAALAEFEGGGIAAEHRVSGPNGGASALCASSANARWMTADGATTIDARTTFSIFNPFPEDALLDVRFVTDRGTALPAALQGISIAARSVYEINAGDFVRRRTRVAAIVRARIGRVVVERTTTFDGSGKSRGTTISPATSAASPTWYFAAGRNTSVLRERYSLFNPTRKAVTAIVDVLIDGVAGVEPFEIDVPPMGRAELVPGSESRIPRNVGYSVVVSTDDGSGIVVERTVDARSRLRLGYASSPGIVAPVERWVLPNTTASSTRSDLVSILNPTDTDASVSFQTLGPTGLVNVANAMNVLVPASGRLEIRLGDYVALDNESLLVNSPGAPIIVERTSQRIERVGDRPFVDPLPTPGRDDSLRALTVDSLPAVATDAATPTPVSAGTSSTTSSPTTTTTTALTAAPAIPVALALLATDATTTTILSPTATTALRTTSASPSTTSSPTTTLSSSTTTTSVSTTTTVAPSPNVAAPASTPSRLRAATPRIGRAALGTSVNGALPLP